DPSLTPNEILRVCRLTCVEAAPFSNLVTSQNFFRFEIGPNLAIVLVVILNPPPPIIGVDFFSTRLDEDTITSPRGKKKHRQGRPSLPSSNSSSGKLRFTSIELEFALGKERIKK
ncbi:unnamed protein product, partial [Ilex paraguariensis]